MLDVFFGTVPKMYNFHTDIALATLIFGPL